MSGDAYSSLKAFRHLDVLRAITAGEPARVPHVELILSNGCQHRCVFCAYRSAGYPSTQRFADQIVMPESKAIEIVDDCARIGVRAIQFTGGGEPTVHPGFATVFGHALALGLKTALVSNGIAVSAHGGHADLIAHAAWVRLSMDAGSRATYAAQRRCPDSHWDRFQTAVRMLRAARDRLGTDCVIGIGFVVTPFNWWETVEAARLARSLGADNFRISAQFSVEDERLFDGFHAEAVSLCREAEGVAGGGFVVYNRFGERLDQLRAKRPTFPVCGYQFLTTYVGADLQMYRCCALAYNEQGHLGSLEDQRFADLWMSHERFERQWRYDARTCERCQFLGINQTLAYVLDPQPQLHEAFV